ncbi:MAG: nickel-dependent lactate racemase [Methanonatronarchaeia archaeon]|nr:MAG: nickel-dependent lactate racemase [Methanonatronarchaeia archaeon]
MFMFDSDITNVKPDTELPELSDNRIISLLDSCGGGLTSLRDFVSDKDSILFVMNDLKRDTPTKKILSLIDRYLAGWGLDSEVVFEGVIATGSHSPPTHEEIAVIAGGMQGLAERTEVHRADDDGHIDLGSTERDTPVLIDSIVCDYDGVICINSVEPHYFAGYTGGRKSLVPGISHWKTIEENHSHALSEYSKVLSLKNNPVHLDMVEACDMVIDRLETSFFGINLVNVGEAVYGLAAGGIHSSFNSMLETADSVFSAKINREEGYDVVIARVGDALNRNLYQSLKGFENGKSLCREGGSLILVSSCSEGIGPEEFYKRMQSGSPSEIMRDIRRNYTLGSHKTFNLLSFLENHDVYIVSELPDHVVRDCFCKPAETTEKALDKIEKKDDVVMIDDAGNFVPRF